MVVTGLEIGSIVIGCVNATLAAAKLLQDWSSKRRERRLAEANQKLASSLEADAASLDHAYSVYRGSLPREHRHRLQKGDNRSKAEFELKRQKIKAIMKSLQKSIRSSKTKDILPNMQKYLAASHAAHESFVRSLARLYQRVLHDVRTPTSSNPFKSMLNKKVQETRSSSTKLNDKVSVISGSSKAANNILMRWPATATEQSFGCSRNHSHVTRSRPEFYIEYEVHSSKVAKYRPVRINAPIYT